MEMPTAICAREAAGTKQTISASSKVRIEISLGMKSLS
jgi:hypothetical protein